MSKQDQSVESGKGYQAGRDLVVHEGVSPTQMAEIMVAMASQLAKYHQEAEARAESRFGELRESIIEEFSREGSGANPEAFNEPDYQYVLQSAHETFARSGDDQLKEELVRLLAQRSAKPTGSRVAFILNEAIRVAGSLTREEFAAISILFLLKYVRLGAISGPDLLKKFEAVLAAFASDLPTAETSFDYLESMGCITVNRLTTQDIWLSLRNTYFQYFTFGFSLKELEATIPDPTDRARVLAMTVPAKAHYGGNIMIAFDEAQDIRQSGSKAGLSEESINQLATLHERTLPTPEAIRSEYEQSAPSIKLVAERWSSSSLQKANLTALGQALAHSSLVSHVGFNTPLEVWIQ